MLTLDPRARTIGDAPDPATPLGVKAASAASDTASAGCAAHCARLCTETGLATAHTAHASELTGYCRRVLADHGLAEEITQEVFLRAWRRCSTFAFRDGATDRVTQNAQLRTWLFAIARNAVIDAARRRGCRPALHPDPEQPALLRGRDSPGPPPRRAGGTHRGAAVATRPGHARAGTYLAWGDAHLRRAHPLPVRGRLGRPTPVDLRERLQSADGTSQVTLAGWPLYWFVDDKAPCDVAGEGVGGNGSAVGNDGKPLVRK